MSYFCQFCDKEMVLKESIVYKKDYITCGAEACTMQASSTADAIADECSLKAINVLIFQSPTPEEIPTWRVVAKEDYPEFIKDEDVLEALMDGAVVGKMGDNKERPTMYYCARHTDEVVRQIHDDAVKRGEA